MLGRPRALLARANTRTAVIRQFCAGHSAASTSLLRCRPPLTPNARMAPLATPRSLMWQVYPRKRALVISTENITQNFYQGNEKSMLISNTLFRMGGAAVLLSGRHADRKVAKYRLLHTVRTHRGADSDAYKCVFQEEDKVRAARTRTPCCPSPHPSPRLSLRAPYAVRWSNPLSTS